MCLVYMYVLKNDCIAYFPIKMQVFLTMHCRLIQLLGQQPSGSKASLTGGADNPEVMVSLKIETVCVRSVMTRGFPVAWVF